MDARRLEDQIDRDDPLIGDRERDDRAGVIAFAQDHPAAPLTITGCASGASGEPRERIDFSTSATGVAWFVAATLCTVGMYGTAEALASRVPKQEEYIARVPAIAIVPWFLAGSLFPISALPIGLEWIARVLPITHALALMRYGLLRDARGLGDIWGMASAQTMAWPSLAVVGAFAAILTAVSVRVFARSALR